jgi:hypothetical protein
MKEGAKSVLGTLNNWEKVLNRSMSFTPVFQKTYKPHRRGFDVSNVVLTLIVVTEVMLK